MLQAPVGPMAVRRDDGGKTFGRRRLQRTVQVAAQVVAGQRLDQDFFNGVVAVLDAPENLRMQRFLGSMG